MAHEGAKTGQARSLRRRMTPAERRLWAALRNRRFHGLVWSRQEPTGIYIVDFYCPAARLVIELDGDAHGYTREADEIRQRWLEGQGIRVERFPNWLILTSIADAKAKLFEWCSCHFPTNGD